MTKSLSGLWSNFLIIFSLLFRHVFSLFPVQECENPTIRLRITLVETWWLGLQIPRIYRKRGWYYVKMIYPEDQEYESALKRCHAVDAKHYKIQ
jgi:hypothetical protein